jgi:hypothetical protein
MRQVTAFVWGNQRIGKNNKPSRLLAVSTLTFLLFVLSHYMCDIGSGLAQAPPAQVDWIEITQAIQDTENRVPLIAGKKTLVRAYISLAGETPLQLLNGGNLILQPPTGQASTVHSINSPILSNQSQTGSKRRTLDGTLNFLLDLPSPGTYTLGIEDSLIDDGGWVIPCRNCGIGSSSYTVRPHFHTSQPLRIKLVPVQYYDPNNFTFSNDMPALGDFAHIRSWIKRAFPVGESTLDVTQWPPPAIVQGAESDSFLIDETPWTSNGTPYLSIPCEATNYKLLIMRDRYITHHPADTSFPVTHLYGLLADRSHGGTVDAFKGGCTDIMGPQETPALYFSRPGSGPTGLIPQSGLRGIDNPDTDQHYGDWYTAHELGHAFGLEHWKSNERLPICDPGIPNPKTPAYINGYLSNPSSQPTYYGYDAGDSSLVPAICQKVLEGTAAHDLMTYCNSKWISNVSYESIWCRLYAENSGGSCPGPSGDTTPPAAPTGVTITLDEPPNPPHVFVSGFHNATERHDTDRFRNPHPILVDHTAAPHPAKRYLRIEAEVNVVSNKGRIISTMLTSSPTAKVGTPDHRAKIRLLDSGNKPLSDIAVTAPSGKSRLSVTGDETDLVLVEMEFDETTKAVELIINGKTRARREVTTAKPVVSNIRIRKNGEGLIPPGMVVFEWDGSDTDGGELTYMVDLSRDGGKTWRPIIVNLTTPKLALPLTRFIGTSSVALRITASDGFNTSSMDSIPLRLPSLVP